MKYQRRVFCSYCCDINAAIYSLPGEEMAIILLIIERKHICFIWVWHSTAAVSIEIVLVGGGRLSSCSFKRAALLHRLFLMRACQPPSHVCAVHNREQGLYWCVLQSAQSNLRYFETPASFCSFTCHAAILVELVVFLMAGSSKPAASGSRTVLLF